ncbi:hypothetical protein [Micromonospora wenchangensis]|uniref:hypothetical protein n=1 Tax=Micromonospora wenchangensis TaxID=1185415 RepID=UPI003821B677
MTDRIPDQPDGIDPRTIAADLMTHAARDLDTLDVLTHIGQAYDVLTYPDSLPAEVLTLVRSAGIDLLWPDGKKDTELDTQRVEVDRLQAELAEVRAERDRLREQVFAQQPVLDAVQAWAELVETDSSAPAHASALVTLHQAVEQYRLMDLALTYARAEAVTE